MSIVACHQELETEKAVRSGIWPEGLRSHADTCPTCSFFAAMHREFESLSEISQAEAILPNSKSIPIEAEWRKRLALQRRFQRSELLMRWTSMAVAAALATVITFAAGVLPEFDSLVKSGTILVPAALVILIWALADRPFTTFSRKVFS